MPINQLLFLLGFFLMLLLVQIHPEIEFLFFAETSSVQSSVRQHNIPSDQPTVKHDISTNTHTYPHSGIATTPTDFN